MKKQVFLPAALALALAAGTALSAPSAFAQTAAQPAPSTSAPALGHAPWQRHAATAGRWHGRGRHFDFTARAAARIAYIKAKLKITPAQESNFDKYAQAIRENASRTQKTFEELRAHRGANMTALDRVEQRARLAAMRADEQHRYLAAFRPLYASLSPEQKKVADRLATPHRHFGRWGHGGPHRG